MIERYLFILLSLALVASVGGFFLYVPILPNVAVAVMLIGLASMFWLGLKVGRTPQPARISQGEADSDQLSLS